MAHTENPWDALAPQFTLTQPEMTEWYDADNPLLAEPVILDYLAIAAPASHKRLLDYGCGSGQFAYRLKQLGYEVDGVDFSRKMIEAAQARYGNTTIRFTWGDEHILPDQPTYDVIVSVMTWQFIDNIELVIRRLSSALNARGQLVVAVHNPDFIADWIRIGHPHYVDFDSVDKPTRGTLLFGKDAAISIYLRTAEEYNELAKKYGLTPQLKKYPAFGEDFLAKYPVNGPTEHAEHMILGYQKTA